MAGLNEKYDWVDESPLMGYKKQNVVTLWFTIGYYILINGIFVLPYFVMDAVGNMGSEEVNFAIFLNCVGILVFGGIFLNNLYYTNRDKKRPLLAFGSGKFYFLTQKGEFIEEIPNYYSVFVDRITPSCTIAKDQETSQKVELIYRNYDLLVTKSDMMAGISNGPLTVRRNKFDSSNFTPIFIGISMARTINLFYDLAKVSKVCRLKRVSDLARFLDKQSDLVKNWVEVNNKQIYTINSIDEKVLIYKKRDSSKKDYLY